ncbi:hypothetical protein G6F52_013982 [Rhizopus delemar]|nr:hypothetical protein G6F52_013982 [Rhizopus delemar]
MVVCGDFNARHQHLLGDSRTTTRGIKLFGWILENGMTCWNAELAYGISTYCAQGRVNAATGEHFNSVIDFTRRPVPWFRSPSCVIVLCLASTTISTCSPSAFVESE